MPLTEIKDRPTSKSICRGFDSRRCHWHNPSGRSMALGSTSASNRNE